MSTFTFTNEDEALITSATKILRSKYRDYVSYEDIKQELYLWAFQNYDRIENWRETRSTGAASRTIIKALRNAGERYCRAEKAEYVGYAPEDEFFYSLSMVADLIQLYFDPEWMVRGGPVLDEPRTQKAPSEGGNLIAMVADVGRAYEALPIPDQEILAFVYAKGLVSEQITAKSLEWDISWNAAYSRIRRVLGRLRANLGGPSPYTEDPE